MDYILGVDGGNTKTIALLATSDGTIIGSGRAGRADIYNLDRTEEAVQAVEEAVTAALQSAGLSREARTANCFSLAGADWPEDSEFWRGALQQQGFGGDALIVNDAIGALYAGLPTGIGVVVACGTGAATGARGLDGRLWHSSFWQETQGSHHLGLKMLRAVYRAELGIGPTTSLTGRVLAFFQLPTVEAVLHRMTARQYRPERRRLPIEQLARPLFDEAQAGDTVAQEIVDQHGAALGDYAIAAARRVEILDQPYTLVLTGGALRHPYPLLRQAIVGRVQAFSPAVQAASSHFEPAVGALMMAMERAGYGLDEPVLARLRTTMPPSALFET